jgi:phage terminase small subunit
VKQTVKSGPKLETFARQYVIHNFNGTETAKAAGYSAKTAAFQASRLLKNVKVKRMIAQLTAAQNKKTRHFC